ncbi:glucans biosynthesis glucosyltransferase H-like [Saccostrea cucullata]|uniref:glucans biosynthesis glucosyltransferase H-like n=1 Tax=Saccostrea cuccullata TaxID=36930 RepID=UPI002ED1C37B
MKRNKRVFIFFGIWILLAFIAILLNVLNVDWTKTNYINAIFIIVVLGVLQGSVMEFPMQTVATLLIGGETRDPQRAKCDRFTILLNYNLLALSKDEIDDCLDNMFQAFMGNLSHNVSAVLVSATGAQELKDYEIEVVQKYRSLIYDHLFQEGVSFAEEDFDSINPAHLEHLWKLYEDVEKSVFITEYLHDICDRFAREFMVIHRVSRVLRKCGQYQDLMLLSEGDDLAFTYCDKEFYGRDARPYSEPLFHDSEDVNNIFGRKFDYTLVLDGDTGVPDGCVYELLSIAAANPERGIIQPAIKLYCNDTDTIFMHIEAMRQSIYEPMTNAVMALLGQSAYFGKAMIKNKIYIERVIGTRENLIERVPVDVLSHDTFEAALLQPLYAGSAYLLEAPSFNFVTWNIRERRWNRGEVLLAMYFWKNAVGRLMRWIQKQMKGDKFNPTKLRTESHLDFVSSFIAYAALRQMMMKPFLLFYVLIHISVHLRYRYASIIIVMFLVLVFPKFATCNKKNYKYVIIETIASILQFTPEAIVGCVRFVKAVQANLGANVKWIPQRAVEDEFRASNCFISSLKHLWGYSVFAVVCSIIIALFVEQALLLLVMFTTLFFLPLYTGVTSLPLKKEEERHFYKTNVEIATGAAHTPGIYRSVRDSEFVNKGADLDTV